MTEKIIDQQFNNIIHPKLIQRSDEEIEILVKSLMEKMTWEEKTGQMYQAAHYGAELVGPALDNSDTVLLLKEGRVGSILSVSDEKLLFILQQIAVEETRLKIPLLFAYDVIHGYKTIFPINLAMACSFDPELIEAASKISAMECGHSGIHMTFAPMIDIVRDPRWGRVMESFGEDVFLGSKLAAAYVKGFQQESLASEDAIAACGKHFIGYGLAEAGREYNTVDVSSIQLYNHYLPPFQSAIDADIASIMTSFNVVDNVPMTGNKKLLRHLLKEEMNFDGVVISDYDASGELMHHKVAKDLKEVAEKCLNAGLDMEMVTKSFVYHLKETDENIIYVNEAVKRILTLKYKLGLFDDPYKGLGYKDKYLLKEYRDKAREVAEASVVLLENNGILPLRQGMRIGLIGPHGDNHEVNGFWSAIGSNEDTVTLKEGLETSGFEVVYDKACDINGERYVSEKTLKEKFKDVDVIILAIGEHQDMSGEGASRSDITVPEGQLTLYHCIKSLDKPVVTIIFSGRPLLLKPFKESDALVQGWFLGTESGHALSNILKGDVSPRGRLTMSVPEAVGQVPLYYNHLPTGRSLSRGEMHRRFSSKYIDVSNQPLYPFGYGLTYGNFEYDHFKISRNHIGLNDEVLISFEITNTSQHQATELVQLYIEATYGQISRPCRELRDYKHVELKPGETKKVEFKVNYITLAYRNHQNESVADSGQYHIYISKHAEEHIYKETLMLEVIE